MLEALQPILYSKLFWVTAVIGAIYLYMKYIVYTYWKRKGIPHDEPQMFTGNAGSVILGQSTLGNLVKKSYDKFKQHPFHGIYLFHQPILMINDPELVRQILIKEFPKFRDRGLYHNEEVDPMSANLFFLPGEKWKHLRAKLSPTFTSGKLKQMFPLLQEIGDELVKICNRTIKDDNVFDMKALIARYTTDSISSIVFGFDCKSLENPDNDFQLYGHKVFDQNPLKNALGLFAPIILDIFRIPLIQKDVMKFFSKTFEDMMHYRRKNKVDRKDFFNLLMQLMDKGVVEDDDSSLKDSSPDKINLAQAQAQAFVFFIAGFETTSSTTTYCLYELALNPEIQETLQAEIDKFAAMPGGLTYDRIMSDMEYLHMTFSETLRKHPSVPFLNRICIEDYVVPNTNHKIEKGSSVMISVTGFHRDPTIFPEPEKFDPLRFTKENVAARSPYVYLPFGDGPRICIGNRFAILQTKIALISLLREYKFSICEKTPIPITYSKRAVTQTPEGSIYLRMEKRVK